MKVGKIGMNIYKNYTIQRAVLEQVVEGERGL